MHDSTRVVLSTLSIGQLEYIPVPPNFTFLNLTARDAETTMADKSLGYVVSNQRVYRYDGSDWIAVDSGNGMINGLDYGLIGNSSVDVSSNMQALIIDAAADNLAVFIPPVDPGNTGFHKISTTVDLGDASFGVHMFGLGGKSRLAPFQFGGAPEFANVSNTNPMFVYDADVQPQDRAPLFENLAFYGNALYYKGGGGGGGVDMRNCGFIAGANEQCITMVDTFWWRFHDCAFTAWDTTHPSIRMIGEAPVVNENITYLIAFYDCIFASSGILYEQNVNYSPNQNPGQLVFINTQTENFESPNTALLTLKRGAGVTDQPKMSTVSIHNFQHFDPVGSTRVPVLRSEAGCSFVDVSIHEALYYGAAIVTTGNVPQGVEVVNPGRDDPIVTNAAGSKLDCLVTKVKNASHQFMGSSGAPNQYGWSTQYGADAGVRWGVRGDGWHEWLDGSNPTTARGRLGLGSGAGLAANQMVINDRLAIGPGHVGGAGTEAYGLHVNEDVGINGEVLAVNGFQLGYNGVHIITGTGDPNGSIPGSPGWLFLDDGGGATSTLWVKESGNNTMTGWVAK